MAFIESEIPLNAILFDLDGTLIDSAVDLGFSLNQLLAAHNQLPVPISQSRVWAGQGAGALVRGGFGYSAQHPELETLKRQLVEIYAANSTRATTFFDGVEQVLSTLEAKGIKWGIVTNKMGFLTQPIVAHLGLDRCGCIVSGDTLAQQKPHPAPLLYACQLLGVEPAFCAYMGDSYSDIQAGHNAGMRTFIASYGYLENTAQPLEWGATAIFAHPLALLTWLNNHLGI